MANELKAKRDARLREAIEREPRIINARKFIGKICVIYLSVRLFSAIMQTVFMLTRGLQFHVFPFLINYALLAAGVLFALGIHRGAKWLCYWLIAGGLMTILNALRIYLPHHFRIDDRLSDISNIAIIFTMLIQIAAMVIILLNRDCKNYFNEVTQINKSIMGQANANRLKK